MAFFKKGLIKKVAKTAKRKSQAGRRPAPSKTTGSALRARPKPSKTPVASKKPAQRTRGRGGPRGRRR